jgi:hypothetical protein
MRAVVRFLCLRGPHVPSCIKGRFLTVSKFQLGASQLLIVRPRKSKAWCHLPLLNSFDARGWNGRCHRRRSRAVSSPVHITRDRATFFSFNGFPTIAARSNPNLSHRERPFPAPPLPFCFPCLNSNNGLIPGKEYTNLLPSRSDQEYALIIWKKGQATMHFSQHYIIRKQTPNACQSFKPKKNNLQPPAGPSRGIFASCWNTAVDADESSLRCVRYA